MKCVDIMKPTGVVLGYYFSTFALIHHYIKLALYARSGFALALALFAP